MEEKLIKLLTNIHEAKTLIEINDLMGLKTPEELKELQDTLNKLISEYKVFFTKKEKYILLKNCLRVFSPLTNSVNIFPSLINNILLQ